MYSVKQWFDQIIWTANYTKKPKQHFLYLRFSVKIYFDPKNISQNKLIISNSNGIITVIDTWNGGIEFIHVLYIDEHHLTNKLFLISFIVCKFQYEDRYLPLLVPILPLVEIWIDKPQSLKCNFANVCKPPHTYHWAISRMNTRFDQPF